MEELIQARPEDEFCTHAASTVGEPEYKYEVDRYGFLLRRPPLYEAPRHVVPKRLRTNSLYLARHLRLARLSGATRMYYTMKGDWY